MTIPYPKGIWAAYGPNDMISASLVADLGIVGVGISEDWANIDRGPNVTPRYIWTALDAKIAIAKAAGLKINLVLTNSSEKTPTYLLDDSLTVNPVRINLIDPSPQHQAYCTYVSTCLYWDPVFHQARKDFATAAGVHYSADPSIIGITIGFANQHSNDFNVLDNLIVNLNCTAQGNGTVNQDQVQVWLDAGWTEAKMLTVGEELIETYATAFPTKNLKLPIGGMKVPLVADYSSLARGIETYVYGGTPKAYATRFYMQRNTLIASWADGSTYEGAMTSSDNYIRKMVYDHRPTSGIQMVEAATGHPNTCRQAGNLPLPPPCDTITVCPMGKNPAFDTCTMQESIRVAQTFGTTFIEVFPQDGGNPTFAPMFRAATLAMGGALRVLPLGSVTVTPGKRFRDPMETVDYADLDALARPVVSINPLSIGTDQLIAADVVEIVQTQGIGVAAAFLYLSDRTVAVGPVVSQGTVTVLGTKYGDPVWCEQLSSIPNVTFAAVVSKHDTVQLYAVVNGGTAVVIPGGTVVNVRIFT